MGFFKSCLWVLFFAGLLVGCKGSDGDDGTINVTLTTATPFAESNNAIGCYIESSSSTQCICYENGTNYTGTASGSTFCANFASSVTLVAAGTQLSSQEAGEHLTCTTSDSTTNFDNFCASGDSNTTAVTLSVNAGESGGSDYGVVAKDGENGADKNYTLTFYTSKVDLTE
ncbi:MAG: hypothetical protein RRB13_10265 [bacterium]|nr:hypothetical protein [bacterium]